MSLKQIYEHLQQVEQELASLVEKEEQKRTERPMMYCFVYEQQYDDAPGWGPNNQLVEAYDIAEAFASFGHVLNAMDLTVRNIHYGAYSEMEEEMQRISEHWSEHHRQRQRREP